MYTLYYSPGAASLVVHWLLIEIGAKHELRKLDLAAGEHKRADYLALNPNGVVPTLLVHGEPLSEAAALVLHLADVHPSFGLAPEPGSIERGRYYQWILHLANTYEVGDEIVMDGAIQTNPVPDLSDLPKDGYARMNALLSMDLQETRMHRWRFNLKTGQTTEEDLDDEVTEFSMISGRYKGRPNRYVYNALMQPNWALVGLKKYDWLTGQTQRVVDMPTGVHAKFGEFSADHTVIVDKITVGRAHQPLGNKTVPMQWFAGNKRRKLTKAQPDEQQSCCVMA